MRHFFPFETSSFENKYLGDRERNTKAVFMLDTILDPFMIFLEYLQYILSSKEGISEYYAQGKLNYFKTTIMSEWYEIK